MKSLKKNEIYVVKGKFGKKTINTGLYGGEILFITNNSGTADIYTVFENDSKFKVTDYEILKSEHKYLKKATKKDIEKMMIKSASFIPFKTFNDYYVYLDLATNNLYIGCKKFKLEELVKAVDSVLDGSVAEAVLNNVYLAKSKYDQEGTMHTTDAYIYYSYSQYRIKDVKRLIKQVRAYL